MTFLQAATHVAAVVHTLDEGVKGTKKMLESLPNSVGWVAKQYLPLLAQQAQRDIRIPEALERAFTRIPPLAQREILFTGQDLAMRDLWVKGGRIAYPVDLDAWDTIGEAEPKSLVPTEVIERLPHANPLIAFPTPIVLRHATDRHQQSVVGVFVTGARPILDETGAMAGHRMCSTHDPHAVGWILTFGGLVEEFDGTPVMASSGVRDIVWTRTTIIPKEGDTLLDLMIRSIERFNAYESAELGMGDHRQDLPVLMARTINLLVYLGAVNADLTPIPWRGRPEAKKTITGSKPPRPPKMIGVGFRVGAQLRAWRRTDPDYQPGPGTGKKIKPHIRRSHPHTYRYGPGRTESYVRWMWPIPINMDLGQPEETTLIPLAEPKPKRKGGTRL